MSLGLSPSVVSLAAPVNSFVSPTVSLGSSASSSSSSSLNPPVASLPSVVSASGSSLAPSVFTVVPWSSPYVFADRGSSLGLGFLQSARPRVSFDGCPGTSGTSCFASEVLLHYPDCDESSENLLRKMIKSPFLGES